MSKALVAPYVASLGAPANPLPEPMITMPPRPRSTIGAASAWHSCTSTVQLRWIIASAVVTGLSRSAA